MLVEGKSDCSQISVKLSKLSKDVDLIVALKKLRQLELSDGDLGAAFW